MHCSTSCSSNFKFKLEVFVNFIKCSKRPQIYSFSSNAPKHFAGYHRPPPPFSLPLPIAFRPSVSLRPHNLQHNFNKTAVLLRPQTLQRTLRETTRPAAQTSSLCTHLCHLGLNVMPSHHSAEPTVFFQHQHLHSRYIVSELAPPSYGTTFRRITFPRTTFCRLPPYGWPPMDDLRTSPARRLRLWVGSHGQFALFPDQPSCILYVFS